MHLSSQLWIVLLVLSGFAEGNESIETVSVKLGKAQVILGCIVSGHDIIDQNVAWYRDETQMTAGQYIIRDRSRLAVVRNPASSEWNLKISNIIMSDAAVYTCKNGNEKILKVRLQIKTPPEIVDHESTAMYEVVKEGDTVELKCKANGDPEPTITWYRKPQHPYNELDLGKEVGVTGNILKIHNVTRYGGDIFVCKASNSLGTKRREMNVTVHFPPEVMVLKENLEADKDQSDPVIMTCLSQGSPLGDVFWRDPQNRMIDQSNYYYKIFKNNEPGYPVQIVTLMVRHIEERQFGDYRCIAEGFDLNGEGTSDEKTVILKERVHVSNEETIVPYS